MSLIRKPEQERKFDAAIYEPVKAAILQSLKGSNGKTFTELTDDVVKIIRKKMPGFKKSIPPASPGDERNSRNFY